VPRCLIIAGPNGAGKTTFARSFLPHEAVRNFVNADLIAAGLSPLEPARGMLAAGRLVLSELDRLVAAKEDFAFESTLSGSTYLGRLREWKALGYRVEIIYLKLDNVALSLKRVAERVRTGGHAVAEADIRRRFPRSWQNFESHYQPLADQSWVFDLSTGIPILLSKKP
jgi:predicted ABC-type ATPase